MIFFYTFIYIFKAHVTLSYSSMHNENVLIEITLFFLWELDMFAF